MISNCNEITKNKIVLAKENGRTFKINNKSKFAINKVKVDNCYIKSNKIEKCDYLFEIIKNENIIQIFYVELKGKELKKGMEQLESTMRYCKTIHKNIKKQCHIVVSRVPKFGAKSQQEKVIFERKNRIKLFIKSTQQELII